MSLILHMPLDGNAQDYTINKNHGTPTNVSWVNGKIGQAGSFNGSSTQIVIPLLEFTGEFSYALWVKPLNLTSVDMFFGGNLSTSSQIKYGFLNGNFFIRVISGNQQVSIPNIQGIWSHIVITRNNENKIDFYLNGVGQRLFSDVAQVGTTYLNVIGNTTDGSNQYFQGELNDIRIYDHALSQKEINDLAKAKVLHYNFNRDDALVMDASGYKRHGSKVGTVTHDINNYLVNLNTFSYIQSPYKLNNDEFTIVTKVRRDVTNSWDVIWSSEIYNNASGYFAYFNSTGGIIVFQNGGVATGVPNVNASTFTNVFEMNEYAFVKEKSGTGKIYINGILRATGTLPNVAVERNLRFNSRYANNGDSGANDSRIKGFGESIVYATALSDADILDLYQTRVKFDDAGNVYANEFVEDYEVADGLTLTQLFEDKNLLVDGDFQNGSLNTMLGYQSTISLVNENQNYYIKTAFQAYSNGIVTYSANYKNLSQPLYNGRKYFLSNRYYTSRTGYINFGFYNGVGFLTTTANNIIPNQWAYHNGIINMNADYSRIYLDYKFIASGMNTSDYVYYDNMKMIDLTTLVTEGYFATEPTQAQMDAWHRDYTRVRANEKGQMIAHELNEVGIDTIVYEGKSYRDIFETGNLVNTDFTGWQMQESQVSNIFTINNDTLTFRNTVSTAAFTRSARTNNIGFTQSNTDKYYLKIGSKTNVNGVVVKAEFLRDFNTGASLFGNIVINNSSWMVKSFGSSTIYNYLNFYATDFNTVSTISNVYYIKITGQFTVEPTQAQMDTWYNTYRQLKLTTQQQRITKDTLVINGEFKEV